MMLLTQATWQDLRLNLLAVMSPHSPALSYQVLVFIIFLPGPNPDPNPNLRDASPHQNGWIFRKLPNWGGVISDPKNYGADFSGLNEHFSLLIFRKRVSPIRKILLQILVSPEKSAT